MVPPDFSPRAQRSYRGNLRSTSTTVPCDRRAVRRARGQGHARSRGSGRSQTGGVRWRLVAVDALAISREGEHALQIEQHLVSR